MLVALFKADAARVQAAGRGAATMLRVLHSLHERPVITLNEVSRRTGLSFPTSAKGDDVAHESWPRAGTDWLPSESSIRL